MNRLARLLVATLATLSVCGRDVCVANVTFPFNATQEDWVFGTFLPPSGTTPYWEWHKAPSSTDGAIRALLLESGSGAGAWAMSPCMELNDSQGQINVDISHFALFSGTIVGQVQYRVATTDSLFGDWTGVPLDHWLSDGDHVAPSTVQPVFPPLLSSSGTDYSTNAWAVFSGTYIASGTSGGDHVKSAFTLTYGGTGTDLGPSVQNGAEIELRFVVGVNSEIPVSGTTPAVLWEVNEVTVDGVKLCKVPEPSTIVLAGGAALVGLAAARRRSRTSRCRGAASGHLGPPPAPREP